MLRTLPLLAAALVIIIAPLPSHAQDKDGLSTEAAAAVKANLQFVGVDPIDAPEDFFSHFAEDVHWNYRGNRAEGIKALKKSEWCHTISGENTARRLEGSGNLAYVLGTYRLSLNCGDEEPVKVEGEFVTIHRREQDGTWRISLYIAGQ